MFSALRIPVRTIRGAAGLGAYEHGTVTVNDAVTGEPQVIRIKEAVENVVQSPAFQQTKVRQPQPSPAPKALKRDLAERSSSSAAVARIHVNALLL